MSAAAESERATAGTERGRDRKIVDTVKAET